MALDKTRRLTRIATVSLVIPLVFWLTAGRTLFPLSADMTPLDNPVKDRSDQSWEALESIVERDTLKQVYWGDLHIHTGLSFDAYLAGTMEGPDAAYRYAKGETVSVLGRDVRITRPLDFAAVTDHAELIGEMYTIRTPGTDKHKAFVPRYLRSVYNDKKENGINEKRSRFIFSRLLKQGGASDPSHPRFFAGYQTTVKAWDVILDAAEKAYEPGQFTTMAGFEWSLLDGNAHLHRNVIFRDMMVPAYPMSSLELDNEKLLWDWLDAITGQGSTVMAIPHNTNLAEGGAFRDIQPDGRPMDSAYASLRQAYEPIIEIYQAKGNSEVHPALWTNDEFSAFENYSFGSPREDNYVRWALKKGLEHERQLGVNPFRFGFIGSTDTHSGTPGNTEESDDFIANHGIADFTPENRSSETWTLSGSKDNKQVVKAHELINPGGLAAVYAEANTRGDIYDALKQREVYGTSGTRIELRFFAGYGFDPVPSTVDELAAMGYASGIPMGGTLTARRNAEPEFLIWARKDAESANLDRVQVIKGWADNEGILREKIFHVALSDGRSAGTDGTVPALDAPVDFNTGEWDSTKGSTEFLLAWSDPEFDPEANAFYYLRVLELPTASWRLWDMIRYGSEFPDGSALTVQERAWSSPIWVSPATNQ
jgi:hypothetical protein